MQGLQNLGATCAVNSMIQIICREPRLRSIILDSNVNDDTLFGNLREIIHLMYNENKSLAPGKFITKLFQSLQGIFRQGEQLDIGELWTFLFDNIATEIHKIPHLTFELDYMNNQDVDIHSENDEDGLQRKYEYVCRRFNADKSSRWLESCQGFYLNITKCKNCNNACYNFEPFTSILLDIPEDSSVSLTSMLRNFLKEETQTDWRCNVCNQTCECTKTMKIWKMPDVLVLIIKRFNANGTKNTQAININKSICFKHGSILHMRNSDKTYAISSFAMHAGGSNGGHYCAICNIDDDLERRKQYENMVLYDDINIARIEKEKFISILNNNRDAYMLVYSAV